MGARGARIPAERKTAGMSGPGRPVQTPPARALPPAGPTVLAGFESTYLPLFGVDSVELTRHADSWTDDLDRVLDAGVRHLRYALRWQLIERQRGRYDWAETDRVLGHLRARGAVVILDLVHHTSYPDWLRDGFRDPRFGQAFVQYTEAVALRYPWLQAYTLFNEPFATLFLAGHEALWPPYDSGDAGFVRLLTSVLPALNSAAQRWRALLPDALHVWVDTAEHHSGTGASVAYAAECNDRRHVVLDLATGHDLDPARPFLARLLAAGGEDLLRLEPLTIDVLGLDYYPHSEWFYDGEVSRAPSPRPVGFAAVAQQYADRYRVPMMLTETNIRGMPSDRVSWFRHMLEQYDTALARGVPLHGVCWFPQVDSCDWDTLLALARGRADPVGVLALGADGSRQRNVFTAAWEAVVRGAGAGELPAYRFQAPNDTELVGFLPMMSHWDWRDPPRHERHDAVPTPHRGAGARATATPAEPTSLPRQRQPRRGP